MDSPTAPSDGSLQPRYRRLLSLGAVLDESMLLFRQHWVTFALVSAFTLLPPGLLLVGASAAGKLGRSFSLADLQTGPASQTAALESQLPVLFGAGIVSVLFGILWTVAIVSTTNAYLRGEKPSLSRVYGRAFRRFFVVLVAGLLFTLGWIVFAVASTVLFVLTLFGVLGTIVGLICLLVWWLRPGARKGWLKWLIILVTPFGLSIYFGVRWSMFGVAAALEEHGPLSALRRSMELVDRHWFRAAAVLAVGSLIVGTMLSAPAAIIEIPLTIGELMRGQYGLSPTETAISYAARLVLQILFGSIGTIIYTLLFSDLRNRREGTDMVERLTQLEAQLEPQPEASPIAANG